MPNLNKKKKPEKPTSNRIFGDCFLEVEHGHLRVAVPFFPLCSFQTQVQVFASLTGLIRPRSWLENFNFKVCHLP